MKLSIRGVLALTFLIALALLAWREWDGGRREQARLARLQAEIENLEREVWLNRPALHQAVLRVHDQFESLRAMRQRAVRHFAALRRKYSAMEPRQDGVLSIRSVPSLQNDAAPAPAIFRLLVPGERPVWLKFGVHAVQRSAGRVHSPESDLELLDHSPFAASGPFEMRLPAGEQSLEIHTGAAHEGSLPIAITLDDRVLMRSAYVADKVDGSNLTYTSPQEQFDVDSQRQLPWLLTARMKLRQPPSAVAPQMMHGFTVWLSAHSSGFDGFPGE